MTHRTTKFTDSRWRVAISALCIIALFGASGCSGLRKNKEPNYKSAQANNPLEIPPDLTAVPPNPGTSIPTASGEPIENERLQEQNSKNGKILKSSRNGNKKMVTTKQNLKPTANSNNKMQVVPV